MADEPDNLTIRILREIQATLLNHDLRFEKFDGRFEQIDQRFEKIEQRFAQVDSTMERFQRQMDHRFDMLDRRLDELNELTIKASGAIAQANVRHDMVQRQLAGVEIEIGDLRSRIERLEEKV